MYEAESRTGAFDKGINFKHSNESNVENTKRLYEIITNGFKYAFIPELPFCPALVFKRIWEKLEIKTPKRNTAEKIIFLFIY